MKRFAQILIFLSFFALISLSSFAQTEYAPPLPGDSPVGGTNGPVGSAPIGNGTFILLTLAAAYAIRKVYQLRVVKEEVTE